ncbi:uncharacterized protein LOC115881054 [Sitophilus oryzae]|uniref:Uncharacterized protein LOC115881054 n=1 Tax=Sitophilus oryzae TaxID=7048 RepID=A0A6J2XUN1_SITOR|nr:uncharacterized protein LOC115881054 [Sitophilus oryzae]
MVIPEVEEVLIKYKKQEEKIQSILKTDNTTKQDASLSHLNKSQPIRISFEEAQIRNKQILKELEFVKGNLRSKAIFSPTELQWEKVCQDYQKNPSLPVKTWHCHLPVFV